MRKPKWPVTPGTQLLFNCGDIVAHQDKPDRGGVVVAIFNYAIRVKWLDTQERGDLDLGMAVLIKRAKEHDAGPKVRSTPRTIVESPARALERWRRQQWENNR
jgi:hypothetical protein